MEDKEYKQEDLIQFSGIKCDTDGCGYHNPDVKFEQYPEYVNKPCPQCGANLLTQENYDATVIYANMLTTLSNNPELMKMAKELEEEMNWTLEDAQQMAELTMRQIEGDLKTQRSK